MKTPFFTPAYVSRSSNLADSQCINLYGEVVETKNGKNIGAFFMTPGLDFVINIGAGPVRGMHVTGDMLYVVSGPGVYSVSMGLIAMFIGNMTTSTGPVSIIDNGAQTAIFDGSQGYLVDAGVLTVISLPFSFPTVASYQDGFGIANQAGTATWFQSDLFDLSTWSSLNFATAQAQPGNLVSIADIHREVWLFESASVEVWVNAGNAGFVFQRLDGIFIENGCAAAFSVAKVGEALCWLSANEQGQGMVFSAQGYQPRRISTSSLEKEIASYSTISDAIAYSYQQEGHLYYVLTFPTGNATWVYDVTTSALLGVPMWHKRAAFLNGQFNRHWGNCYAFFNNLHMVGDYLTGNIYSYNLATKTDNGSQRKWVRTWRALSQPVMQPVTFPNLQIDMQTGLGVPDGTDPDIVLRWSDDGGHVWSNEIKGSCGKSGETGLWVKFNRLGSTRRNTGLDRIFELSSTDQFDVALIGAEIAA